MQFLRISSVFSHFLTNFPVSTSSVLHWDLTTLVVAHRSEELSRRTSSLLSSFQTHPIFVLSTFAPSLLFLSFLIAACFCVRDLYLHNKTSGSNGAFCVHALDEFIYRTSFFPRKILIINLLIFITTNLILYTVIVFNSRRHSHHPNKKKRHWTQYILLFFNVDNILFIETIWCKKIQTN